jgi:hypothetical protein
MTTNVIVYSIVFAFLAAVVIGAILTITSIRLHTVRLATLQPPAKALTLTGFSASETNAVLRRIAKAQGSKFRRTGQRFTVVVDESTMTFWGGSTQPERIASFPLAAISDVAGGTTEFGRITYQTLFLGVNVEGKTYGLQIRVAGLKGINRASAGQRDEYLGEFLKRLHRAAT